MKTPAEWIEYKNRSVPWPELIAAVQREAIEECAKVVEDGWPLGWHISLRDSMVRKLMGLVSK